jgi:thioredoxin reductase
MAKRTKENITLGSGKVYIVEYDGTMPTTTEICVAENLLGHIQGGAELSYTAEPYEEKDDLGLVSKTVVNAEEAILKLGLLTWNGTTLKYLADRCTVTEGAGKRTIKIGGAGNAQGKEWVVCFAHEDKKDGNLWVMIRGNNSAGFTLTFAVDAGTKIEPEFKALPQDDAGTLITIEEETSEA